MLSLLRKFFEWKRKKLLDGREKRFFMLWRAYGLWNERTNGAFREWFQDGLLQKKLSTEFHLCSLMKHSSKLSEFMLQQRKLFSLASLQTTWLMNEYLERRMIHQAVSTSLQNRLQCEVTTLLSSQRNSHNAQRALVVQFYIKAFTKRAQFHLSLLTYLSC